MKFQLKYHNVVNYFGITLYLPPFVQYVATDADGTITGYASKPKASEHAQGFVVESFNLEDYTTNGYILFMRLDLLEGDWRDSCISVSQLLWKMNNELSRQHNTHHQESRQSS